MIIIDTQLFVAGGISVLVKGERQDPRFKEEGLRYSPMKSSMTVAEDAR